MCKAIFTRSALIYVFFNNLKQLQGCDYVFVIVFSVFYLTNIIYIIVILL